MLNQDQIQRSNNPLETNIADTWYDGINNYHYTYQNKNSSQNDKQNLYPWQLQYNQNKKNNQKNNQTQNNNNDSILLGL